MTEKINNKIQQRFLPVKIRSLSFVFLSGNSKAALPITCCCFLTGVQALLILDCMELFHGALSENKKKEHTPNPSQEGNFPIVFIVRNSKYHSDNPPLCVALV